MHTDNLSSGEIKAWIFSDLNFTTAAVQIYELSCVHLTMHELRHEATLNRGNVKGRPVCHFLQENASFRFGIDYFIAASRWKK